MAQAWGWAQAWAMALASATVRASGSARGRRQRGRRRCRRHRGGTEDAGEVALEGAAEAVVVAADGVRVGGEPWAFHEDVAPGDRGDVAVDLGLQLVAGAPAEDSLTTNGTPTAKTRSPSGVMICALAKATCSVSPSCA
jgi:hypothetical protein